MTEIRDLAAQEARIQADQLKRKLEERYVACAGCNGSINLDGSEAFTARGGHVFTHPACHDRPNAASAPVKIPARTRTVHELHVSPEVREYASRVVRRPTEGRCVKHAGGAISECSTGERQANRCANSRWGSRALFDGPCPCSQCHYDSTEAFPSSP